MTVPPARESIVRSVIEDMAEAWQIVDEALRSWWKELGELGSDPARTRLCLVAAITVPLATTMALWLQAESVWWAAISGYMTIMASGAASVRRGLLRLAGTIAGAVAGFILARWLPYDHVLLCLFLAAATMLGVIAMQVSPHGLAWLFATITSLLVLLEGLNDPLRVPYIAFYRVFEVGIGVTASAIVSNLLMHWHADPPPTVPGWRHLLGPQWPAVLHGLRAAIAVVIMMQVWIWMDLPQVTEMAISIAVVMSAPVIGDGSLGTRHAVAQRSLHRILGCLLGGIAALGCLALQVMSFPWWLAMLGGAVWIGMHVQNGRHGVGYVGTQAAFVFIVTLVQGPSPPTSILPGIDRFVGIVGGMAILLVISLMLWPNETERKIERAA
ncbi:MAG: FUSC family protein [Reyranella sp.]|nr:FUSC family protein [Reyranella sp.]